VRTAGLTRAKIQGLDQAPVVRELEVSDRARAALVAVKTIYANHYSEGRVQMGAVLDGEAALGVPGHFLLLVDRVRFDEALNAFKRKLLARGLDESLRARLEFLGSLADGASREPG
jgi:hypothetical protein